MKLRAEIARLRELERAATKGDWTVFHHRPSKSLSIDCGGRNGRNPCVVHWLGFDGNDLPHKEAVANAKLMAASKNALPRLLAAIERMDVAAKAVVDNWGREEKWHPSVNGMPGYWSPHSAQVESEVIANLRAALLALDAEGDG